jgi:hypothetical protein
MVIVFESDEAERLQDTGFRLSHGCQKLGHAVNRPRLGLKREFDEGTCAQSVLELQQASGHGDGLEFCFCAPAIFQTDCSQDRFAKLDPGRAPRRVRLGEVSHRLKCTVTRQEAA